MPALPTAQFLNACSEPGPVLLQVRRGSRERLNNFPSGTMGKPVSHPLDGTAVIVTLQSQRQIRSLAAFLARSRSKTPCMRVHQGPRPSRPVAGGAGRELLPHFHLSTVSGAVLAINRNTETTMESGSWKRVPFAHFLYLEAVN